MKWSLQSESNQRPTDYKSVALPTELCRPVMFRERILGDVNLKYNDSFKKNVKNDVFSKA
jgi:hypothetical protein